MPRSPWLTNVAPQSTGIETLEVDGEHVTRLGAADADRADDRVRTDPRVLAAQLRQFVDRDAWLQSIQEVRPRVGIDDHVARLDLEDIGQGRIEHAQAHGALV